MSQQNRQAIDHAKERVKEFLPQYLTQMGVNVSPQGKFKCIAPDHQDTNPSAGIVPHTDNKLFHCFACHTSGSIFEAAAWLEDKPQSGPGFLSDTLRSLGDRFGIEIPIADLTPEEEEEMETYSAYSYAATIVRTSPKSDLVKQKIAEYGWPNTEYFKIGLGSVVSYDDYIDKMTKKYGFKLAFLQKIDLTRKLMFSPNNLIYPIKDEHGSTVGFGARNLKYEEERATYLKQKEELIALYGEKSDKLKELFEPRKCINTTHESLDGKIKNPIYQKGRRLFNFCLARKHTPPLYIVEGQADAVTMWCAGIKNTAAICSTAFTTEHLDMILSFGINHVVFVLDADDAGANGTAKVMTMLEETGGHVGLKVEIIEMPAGTDDPDKYIRSFGLSKGGAQFRKLPRIDMFSWRLKQAIESGEDREILAEKTVPMIVNERNYLRRGRMTEQLAQITNLDYSMLWREVLRLVDHNASHMAQERTAIAQRVAKELQRDSQNIEIVLEGARTQIDQLERSRIGYRPETIRQAIDLVREEALASTDSKDLLVGFPVLECALNGIPTKECFISLPGKPNQGKSTFLDNLAFRLVDHNPDAMVLFHSVDDALSSRLARLQGAKFNLRSEYFKRSGFWLKELPSFEEKYNQATIWMDELVNDERLIVTDVSCLPASLPSLENWVKELRQKFPKRHMIVMGDNFHLYNLPGYDPGEEKVREMSKFIKAMTTKFRCTMMFTTELPKESLRPGVRPRIGKIKGTSGVAYDANANLGIYNDMKDMAENAKVFWTDNVNMKETTGPNGEKGFQAPQKPVIEVVVDKNKLSDFDGVIYYKLWPETGHMEECTTAEQDMYRGRALTGGSTVDLAHSQAPYQAAFPVNR